MLESKRQRIASEENELELMGYARWRYEQGQISRDEYLRAVEEIKQARTDTVAADLLADVDLSGLD